MENKYTFFDTIVKASIPDLAETLSICVNPAEADMLLTIGLYKTYHDSIPEKYLVDRFDYHQPWHFFDKVFNLVMQNKSLSEHLSCCITSLYEENPFSLGHDDAPDTSPYHPYLDRLPPLFFNDGRMINLKGAEFTGIITNAANLDQHYKEITTRQELAQEFKALNMRDNPLEARFNRLEALTEVRYIKEHPLFPELNYQRGVYAKSLIPAGTVIGYVTGDAKKIGDTTPPILCSWPIASYRFKFSFAMARHFVHTYTEWVDSYIIGNRLKLVNSCIPDFKGYKPIKPNKAPEYGNIGCYFGHFISENEKPKYMTVPFYLALRDIHPDEELMTFYGC